MTTEQHEIFKRRLIRSAVGVSVVAGYYIRKTRYDVSVPRLHIPAEFANGKSDHGDFMVRPQGGEWQTVEVKWRYQYPYAVLTSLPTLLVYRKNAWDALEKKPRLVYSVTQELTHAFWIDTKTCPPFTEKMQTDRELKLQPYRVYELAREHWNIVNLCATLSEMKKYADLFTLS